MVHTLTTTPTLLSALEIADALVRRIGPERVASAKANVQSSGGAVAAVQIFPTDEADGLTIAAGLDGVLDHDFPDGTYPFSTWRATFEGHAVQIFAAPVGHPLDHAQVTP